MVNEPTRALHSLPDGFGHEPDLLPILRCETIRLAVARAAALAMLLLVAGTLQGSVVGVEPSLSTALGALGLGMVAAPATLVEYWGQERSRRKTALVTTFFVAILALVASNLSLAYALPTITEGSIAAGLVGLGNNVARLANPWGWALSGTRALFFVVLVGSRSFKSGALGLFAGVLGVSALSTWVTVRYAAVVLAGFGHVSLSWESWVTLVLLPTLVFPAGWWLGDRLAASASR